MFDIEPALEAAGEPNADLADQCLLDELPVLSPDPTPRVVSLAGLDDDHASACGTQGLLGPDGFFAVDASAGERWHFYIEPREPHVDVALFFLDSCDTSSCDSRYMVNRCGPGGTEEYTNNYASDRRVIVGVDSFAASDGELTLFAHRMDCGDGVKEHGEVCDDGNVDGGDGCDASCRAELLEPKSTEVEANNWHSEANVVVPRDGVGIVEINGELSGGCDQDHYAFTVPNGGRLRATMFDEFGTACSGLTPPATMVLMDPSNGTPVGEGDLGGSAGACPAIGDGATFAENMPGMEYHLMLLPAQPTMFRYRLVIEISMPTGGP